MTETSEELIMPGKLDAEEQADLEAELVRSQVEAHLGEDGARECSRCGCLLLDKRLLRVADGARTILQRLG